MPDSVGSAPDFANWTSPEPSGLDIPVCITKFPTAGASSKEERRLPLRAIVGALRDTRADAKAALPWLKLAAFGDLRTERNSLRHDRNVLSIHGVEGDYDGEQITIERARQILAQAGIAAILYTSPSHTPQAPRWRVLCPTSEALPPAERARLLARLNGLFVGALSRESFTLSQSYYYGAIGEAPHHVVVAIDGRPIDLAHELDAQAIGRPEPPKPPPASVNYQPHALGDGTATRYARKALENECSAIVNAPDGGKHHALNKAAYSIGGLVTAGEIDEGYALGSLADALGAIRHRCEDFAAAERTLRQAFEDGKAARRIVPEAAPAFDPSGLGIFRQKETTGEISPGTPGASKTADPAPGEISPTSPQSPLWVDIDAWEPQAIPRRPWVVPNYLMRGSVSVLSGQGAGGKSSLVVAWTISAATGAPIGEFKPPQPLICVNYNTEDDQDEQRRRYSAALADAGKEPRDIARRVLRCGPQSIGTLFERDQQTGRVVPTTAMQALEYLCEQSGADVLICDPLAELHNAEENDNTAMRAVVAAFRGMAQRLGIAILILHHDRKGNNAPGDMDRMRGASSITGAVRVMLTLTTMSQEEAEKFNIPPDQRRRHFRVDGAKSNYAPAQDAEWWRLSGVEIPNGETVAAARPWSPPGAFDGIAMSTCVAILEAMQRGLSGAPYGSQGKARGELFAMLAAEPFNLPKGQASALIAAWLSTGTITEQADCPSPNSNHRRSGFVVNPAKISEMRHGT